MRIKEALQRGMSSLDSEVLLAHTLGETREYLITHDDEEIESFLIPVFDAYLKRAESGEPVAYITGQKEFFGLDFFVDKRVLIPRPETELLVERVLQYLDEIGERKKRFRLLDVGTGSCNIPISIVKQYEAYDPDMIESFTALEKEDGALEVAKINIDQHSADNKINLYQSDLLEVIDEGESFDVITANLPYIGQEKHRYIAKNAKDYEPHSALFGGSDGLRLYEELFKQLIEKSIRYDMLIGEFGFSQREDLEKLLRKFFGGRFVIEKDLSQRDRLFIVQ